MKKMTVEEWQLYYVTKDFQEKYHYFQNNLGAFCTEGGTEFRLWSPPAAQVLLHLYPDGEKSSAYETLVMTKEAQGVWVAAVKENLHRVYYDYEICIDEKRVHTGDPYARACGINGNRSMVVELAKTNPTGWQDDCPPAKQTEDIIYELHVKEFSHHASGGFSKEVRGRYKAFTTCHTTRNQNKEEPTGMDYLKTLGVNYVQIMPFYDFGSVDEGGADTQFNWGYDPVNYNVPEGSYATDARNGEVRIREAKEMIQALHKNGFRVIMDVVYNHTYSADSWLNRTVPGYYYRHEKDGKLANGSGCGNDVASERPMCGKYILDSVLYWAREYHVDGFRFDLMGLLDVNLMNQIRAELDRQYGRGEKLLFGEPWAASSTPMENSSIPALKENIRILDKEVGIFCDGTRDAVKGHVFEEEAPGFVNGGRGLENPILNSITGWCDSGEQGAPLAPSQIITYLSAHDNLTLWDKLVRTMGSEQDFHSKNPGIMAAAKLAAAICFTCQGRIFFLSGEEFGRTKDGDENSYCSSIERNCLDWNRAYEYEELRTYYQGLIALRKKLPGLCDKSENAYLNVINKKIEAEGCVSFSVKNGNGKTDWRELFIVYNSAKKEQYLSLPSGKWQLLVDGNSSEHWQKEKKLLYEGAVEVPGKTALIMGK